MLIDLLFGHSKYAATTTRRNRQNTNHSSIYAATKRAASIVPEVSSLALQLPDSLKICARQISHDKLSLSVSYRRTVAIAYHLVVFVVL